jgi:hypothetical protein
MRKRTSLRARRRDRPGRERHVCEIGRDYESLSCRQFCRHGRRSTGSKTRLKTTILSQQVAIQPLESRDSVPRTAVSSGVPSPRKGHRAGFRKCPQVLRAPPCKLMPAEKLAQFGERVGEGASACGLLQVGGGGLLIAGYHLVPRLWCREGLRVMLLLVRTVT